MADTFSIPRARRVNSGDNGTTLVLSDISDNGEMGAWHVHFVDDADSQGAPFVGSLTVVTKTRIPPGTGLLATAINWVKTPFRRIFLNGQPQPDYSFSSAMLTTTSVLLVPASGGYIGLQVNCASGGGWLYTNAVSGESAIG